MVHFSSLLPFATIKRPDWHPPPKNVALVSARLAHAVSCLFSRSRFLGLLLPRLSFSVEACTDAREVERRKQPRQVKKPIPPAAAAVPVTDETSQASQAASTNLLNEGASRPGIGRESCNAIQRVRAKRWRVSTQTSRRLEALGYIGATGAVTTTEHNKWLLPRYCSVNTSATSVGRIANQPHPCQAQERPGLSGESFDIIS